MRASILTTEADLSFNGVPWDRLSYRAGTYDRETRQLVTDEPVEFQKQLVEVQDCRRIIDHFRGVYRIYPDLIKGKPEDVNM